jgi:hypothetical protein
MSIQKQKSTSKLAKIEPTAEKMEKEVYECSIEQLDEMIQEQIEKQKAQK